jgi:predicted enzyme related to lactoylglutathione lyase
MTHPVVHFEIVGEQGGALKRFYEDAFGWTVNADNPMNYGLVAATEPGIGGGVMDALPDGQSRVTIYIQAADLAAALASVEAAGGRTLMPPEAVEGGPEIALFADPAGNMVGLVKGM